MNCFRENNTFLRENKWLMICFRENKYSLRKNKCLTNYLRENNNTYSGFILCLIHVQIAQKHELVARSCKLWFDFF